MNQEETEFFGVDGDLITMDVLTGQMPVLRNQREYSGADGDNFPEEYGYEEELELAEWEDFVDEDGYEDPEYEYAYFEEVESDDEFFSSARGRRRKKKRRKRNGLFGGRGRERRQKRRAERKSRREERRNRRREKKDFRMERRRGREARKNQRQDRRSQRAESKSRAREARVAGRMEARNKKMDAKMLGAQAQQDAIKQMGVVDPTEQAMMMKMMADSETPGATAGTTGMSKNMKTGLIIGGAVVVLLIGVVVIKSMANKNK